jgi:hypothetical protein
MKSLNGLIWEYFQVFINLHFIWVEVSEKERKKMKKQLILKKMVKVSKINFK